MKFSPGQGGKGPFDGQVTDADGDTIVQCRLSDVPLIAAAPEMYALLRDIPGADLLDPGGWDEDFVKDYDAWLGRREALLAFVDGKEQP